MIELSLFWRNIGFDVSDVLLNTFADDLLANHCVEENIELDYHFLQIVFFVGVLFCHKETVFFLEDVLDLTYDV
jgi:hypothetical protein